MTSQPKKLKYYKQHRQRFNGNIFEKNKLIFGKFGLQAQEPGRLTNEQIEAARRIIKSSIKKFGILWVRVSCNIPLTKKAENSRMGAGKGNVKYWVSLIKPGKIIFEINDISLDLVKIAFSLASSKLPIKTKLIIKI